MRILIAVILTLTIYSFYSFKLINESGLVGKYSWNPNYGVSASLELNSDSTFEYHWVTGLISGISKGKWKIEKSELILNSEKQPSAEKEEGFKVLEERREESDSLSIIVQVKGEVLPFAVCSVQGEKGVLKATTDFTGKATFPRTVGRAKLEVTFVGYKTINLDVDRSVSTYELEMLESKTFEEEHYQYFTNEIWTIDKAVLCSPADEYGNKKCLERSK